MTWNQGPQSQKGDQPCSQSQRQRQRQCQAGLGRSVGWRLGKPPGWQGTPSSLSRGPSAWESPCLLPEPRAHQRRKGQPVINGNQNAAEAHTDWSLTALSDTHAAARLSASHTRSALCQMTDTVIKEMAEPLPHDWQGQEGGLPT